MSFDWYKLTNLDDFEALGLVSQKLTLDLEGLGHKDILVTKANAVSILFDGIFLTIGFNEKNPFEFEGHAVYLDENRDIWLGIENES